MKIDVIDALLFLIDAIVRWFVLCVLTLITVMIAFRLWMYFNPRTMGFMGDESPYNFEGMSTFLYVIFSSAPLAIVAIYHRYKLKRGALSYLIWPLGIGFLAFILLLIGAL
jgi:hypothetical protein